MNKKKTLTTLILILAFSLVSNLLLTSALSEYGVEMILENPDTTENSRYGCALAVNQEYLFIGAEYMERDGEKQVGRVYVYDFKGNYVTALYSTDWENTDKFGARILSDDELILVTESELGFNSIGQCYLYDSEGDFITKIDSPNPDFWGWFGTDTCFLEDKILITEPCADTDYGLMTGRIQVYDKTGNYIETKYSPEPTINSGFGFQVEANNEIIAVTEIKGVLSDQVYIKGFVHVLDHDWNSLMLINAPDPETKNVFGWSLQLSDEYIYVGDPYAMVGDLSNVGKVYIYDMEGTLQTTIDSPTVSMGTYFGEYVTIQGDRLFVGAPRDDSTTLDAGKIYIYSSTGEFIEELEAPEPSARGYFGSSIALIDDIIVAGADGENKVYMFSKGATGTGTTETSTEIETEQETEVQSNNGVPGFPLSALACGLVLILVWSKGRENNTSNPFFS